MNQIETLKKYKELLDKEIITQEEFDAKKKEFLMSNESNFPDNNAVEAKKRIKLPKIQMRKALGKKLLIAVGIIAIFIIGFFGVKKAIASNQESMRAAALEEEIKPIMNRYGLYHYKVKKNDYRYDVYAEGFESLTKGEGLDCLKELDGVSIDDPCGDDKIDFGTMTNVHPGLDVEYSYWRVSSQTIWLNEMFGGNYKVPGIYCDRNGLECIYECKS